MGAAFIVFALVSSFVIPRRMPNFPGGRGVWPYVGVVVTFFVAMMAVVVFVGREKSEAKAETTPPASTIPSGKPQPPPPGPKGNAAAGKAVFAANACASCHTFKPAGANGKIGPDLGHLAADAQKANRGSLVQYTTESIVDPNAYIVHGFAANIMPKTFGQSLSKQQLADLVAFLTSSG